MSRSARDPTLTSELTGSLVEVVREARAGNVSAFDILFQQYNPRICTYLGRMVCNDEEGRDLAQETFLKAWRALPGMNDEMHFDTWLYRIATNTAIDHLRRRKFRWPLWKNAQASQVVEDIGVAGPEAQIAEAEIVKLALAQLSPQYRACLLLQHVVGFTQREIAQSVNL